MLPEFTARSEKLKGQFLHPLLLPVVVTQIYATLLSQKCRNVTANSFIALFFSLRITALNHLFHLTSITAVLLFFYSLKSVDLHATHKTHPLLLLSTCLATSLLHVYLTHLLYTSPKHCPAVPPFSSLLFSVIFQSQALGPQFHI